MKESELKILYRPVNDLIPYANNARTHSEEQVNQIASSIKEFGFNNPILVDEQGGVIAGHGRLKAAKKLGLKVVPTIKPGDYESSDSGAFLLSVATQRSTTELL